MKLHPTLPQPLPAPDRLRRRLLMALPGGLAILSPFGLVSCGGGADEPAPAAPSADALSEPGRAFAGTQAFTSSSVTVELPAGLALPEEGLATYTPLGGFGPVSAGRATVRHLFETPQWTTVIGAEGQPLLFGFVGAGMSTLSVHSTATALLAFAMGAEWSEGTTHAAWIEELDRSPATATFAQAIAGALAADRFALAVASPAIAEAAAAALRVLMPAVAGAGNRARPLGLSVNPPNGSSGVQPIIGEIVNTAYVQNEKLRRAYHVIRREGHTDSSGADVADAARPVIVSGDIPMLPGFDSAGSIIGSVALAHYAQDSTGLAYSRTAETPLPLAPADAKRTKYSVTVLTAGNAALSYDEQAYAKLDDNEKRMIDITLFAPENLALRQLFLDLLVPLFLSWLGGKIGDEAKSMGTRAYKEKIEAALFGNILALFQGALPSIAAKIRDPKTYPNYGVGGALNEIVRGHLVEFVEVPIPGRTQPLSVPALSKFSISMLLMLLKYLAYEKMNESNGEALLRFLDGDENNRGENLMEWQPPGLDKSGKPKAPWQFNKENLQFAGLGVATKILALVDDSLGLLSKTRLLADMATSRLLERWEVTAIQAKVRLRPNPLEVDVTGALYAVTADIVDNDNDAYGNEKGSFSFDWVCTAQAGDLYKRSSNETNTFTTSNTNATVDYVPRGVEPAAGVVETIVVTAYFEPIGSSKPRELIGKFTLPVKFKKAFNLLLSPQGPTDVPTDSPFPLTAVFKETLPAGSTVDWEWSHSGVGSLQAQAADATPNDSTVSFQSGASEGAATVTVRATVNVPGSATQAPRHIVADAVSTTLNVKKGLRQIVMEVSGGIFGCTDPKACGVGSYTAFIVPRLPKATSYSASITGYTYPGCTRTVTWNAPLGDRGGCNFPVSYHPHTSQGATNQWAVWVGFGGPVGAGRCVVTITLAP